MDDKIKSKLMSRLVPYFKEVHLDDIISETKRVVVDLKNVHDYGFFEFLDYLEENPYSALELLNEAYADAYFSYKMADADCTVTVKNLPESLNRNSNGKPMTIEDIKGENYGKLVEVEGIVVMATKIKLALKEAVYVCASCGQKKKVTIERPFEMHIGPQCPKCSQNMLLLDEESKYVDYQELKIQQPLDLMDDPEDPPKFISVLLEYTPGIYCGRIKVTGIPIKNQKNKKIPLHDILIGGYNCEPVTEKLDVSFTENEIKKFESLAKNKDVLNILSGRIAPQIKGNEIIKQSILLQQVRGVKKGKKRADSHILLITDPGTGKSDILRFIAGVPGCVYSSISTASGVGLTAGVVQEKTEIGDSTWVIKPGVLVKANGGTACLDELTVERSVLSYILEAMESQTIHVSKGGLNTKLPAGCSILAACNPKYGRYDKNIPVIEQINIPAPLLSRFDLIFPIKDTPNRKRDSEIANHILDTHIAYMDESKNKEIGLFYEIIDEIKIDFDFFCKYIAYARQKTPKFTKESKQVIHDFYLDLRKSSVQITARQLEALVRLSEAHAKLKLKDLVEEEDAKFAIYLMTESLKEVAYDQKTKSFDIDRLFGNSKVERNELNVVYDIIRLQCENSEHNLAKKISIIKRALEYDISDGKAVKLIDKLIGFGDIEEISAGTYRMKGV
ncbi:ATP-binding protein [Methanococcus maripaludis]|uniref:Replicative DNA helicase Mcm n=1 Tax=Methanococcus maripaludis TaxID=39152 RepID=A0A7J9SBU5_METMI|nr:minichromosome maintenance protein MCM [Methanococcus maripaludis]MBB6497558.1 replicative DNA helicase Mcm [Methanococcus maripaludis]